MSTAGGKPRTPRDDLWDVLADRFGQPRTKTERSQFGKVVAELLEAGANVEETERVCDYVLRTFDSPSVFSITKWFSVAQQDPKRQQGAAAIVEQLRRAQ